MATRTAASNHARALDPWSYPPPQPHVDIRKLVGGFETVEKAKAEHDLRVRHLRMADAIEHGRLVDKLESCAFKARCRSAACPICCRRLRMWFIGAVLEILGEIPDPIVATLIPGDQAVPTGDLRDFSPKRFGDMLGQQLRRAGAGKRPTRTWGALERLHPTKPGGDEVTGLGELAGADGAGEVHEVSVGERPSAGQRRRPPRFWTVS